MFIVQHIFQNRKNSFTETKIIGCFNKEETVNTTIDLIFSKIIGDVIYAKQLQNTKEYKEIEYSSSLNVNGKIIVYKEIPLYD